MKERESWGKRWPYRVNITALCLFALSILLVFINIYALAFNDGRDAARGGIYFFPRQFSLENFQTIFQQNSNILNAYKISILRTLIGTVLSTFLTAMAAFTLKRHRLPGSRFVITFLLVTMLFSGGLIPKYIVLNRIHLLNTVWVYIIPSLYSAWNILIMKTFFNSIPESLEETAKMAGANDFFIFIKVYLPLSGAVIAVIALFNAVGQWNDWFEGAFFVRSRELKPVQTLLQEMLSSLQKLAKESSGSYRNIERASQNITGESVRMAMIVIVTFPIICVYPFAQKYFVRGAMLGSVKE
ncbi:MAG: carbohydrate ABC transporter permease [Spirochaetota bacterium]